MVLGAGNRRGAGMGRVGRTIAYAAIATALWCAGAPAVAQTLNDSLAGRARTGQGNARLLVEAKEIVYDNDRNTVAASGDVELNYQGRTLQADRVTYDRNTGRVYAEGNARLTDASGAVVTGARFELTDDFKNGFIDSLQVEQTVVQQGVSSRARFSAPRAERTEGDTTVFQRGTYTACDSCKENPTRPPAAASRRPGPSGPRGTPPSSSAAPTPLARPARTPRSARPCGASRRRGSSTATPSG